MVTSFMYVSSSYDMYVNTWVAWRRASSCSYIQTPIHTCKHLGSLVTRFLLFVLAPEDLQLLLQLLYAPLNVAFLLCVCVCVCVCVRARAPQPKLRLPAVCVCVCGCVCRRSCVI